MVPYISPNRLRTGILSKQKGINYFCVLQICQENIVWRENSNIFLLPPKNTLTLKSEGKHTRTHISQALTKWNDKNPKKMGPCNKRLGRVPQLYSIHCNKDRKMFLEVSPHLLYVTKFLNVLEGKNK